MKYTVNQLDQKSMPVKQFLKEYKDIPYYKIVAGYHFITISELKEKYYDNTIFFYNEPKEFGVDCEGECCSFDRLFAEVQL